MNIAATWQPRETAPTNSYVLLFLPGASAGQEIIIGAFLKSESPADAGDWYEQCESAGGPLDIEPTHWMPLPDPPTTGGAS